MKGHLRISKKQPIAWIPKVITNAGFEGTVPFLANAKTIVLMHPKASLEEIKRSLEIILQDIELRRGNSNEGTYR